MSVLVACGIEVAVGPLEAGSYPAGGLLSVARVDRVDGVLLVARGELDMATEGQLAAAAVTVLQERVGAPLVLDMSCLTFVGSTGIRELLMIQDEAVFHG